MNSNTSRSMTVLGVVCGLAFASVGSSAATPDTTDETNQEAAVVALQEEVRSLQMLVDGLQAQLQKVSQQLKTIQSQQQTLEKQKQREKIIAAAQQAAAQAQATDELEGEKEFALKSKNLNRLNPEISVSGILTGQRFEGDQWRFGANEFEADFTSYLDPFARFRLVFTKPQEEAFEVEEGYMTWLRLPLGVQMDLGIRRQQFGVLNRWHTHALDQVDRPLVLEANFGEEGLKGTGVFFSRLFPTIWSDAQEISFEITNGDNEEAFAGSDWQRLTYALYYKNYWDITDNTLFEIGLSGVRGPSMTSNDDSNNYIGVHTLLNWTPAGRSLYRELTLRGLWMRSEREFYGQKIRSFGAYVYGQYKWRRNWWVGLRYDDYQDPFDPQIRTTGWSPYLTFWQSEWVRLRGQYSFLRSDEIGNEKRFFLQAVFSAGPHKHETY